MTRAADFGRSAILLNKIDWLEYKSEHREERPKLLLSKGKSLHIMIDDPR